MLIKNHIVARFGANLGSLLSKSDISDRGGGTGGSGGFSGYFQWLLQELYILRHTKSPIVNSHIQVLFVHKTVPPQPPPSSFLFICV